MHIQFYTAPRLRPMTNVLKENLLTEPVTWITWLLHSEVVCEQADPRSLPGVLPNKEVPSGLLS